MQDPNWFYSALSQCAAAIIGIISAIIISRILMISSEKNGLLNKINELDSQINNLSDNKKILDFDDRKLGEHVEYVDSWNEKLDLEINLKDSTKDELIQQFYLISFPKHIKIGIIILIFSSFISVVFPLSILLLSNFDSYLFYSENIIIGGMVLILFIVSLLAIFSYVILEIKYILSKDLFE